MSTQTGYEEQVREQVRRRYAGLAPKTSQAGATGCCSGSCGQGPGGYDPITRDLYTPEELADLPDGAAGGSLGSGNPVALADLKEGDVVLDLGSGAGIDVLLAARRVGSAGKVYGLDMTDEMLEAARENRARVGAKNVEFLRGTIEEIPLPDNSVDVVISNCVINLSPDKDRVLREVYRVLKPGGQLCVSDVVHTGEMPDPLRRSIEAWAGCVAGSLEASDYVAKLEASGFRDSTLEPTRVYGEAEVAQLADQVAPQCCGGRATESLLQAVSGKFMSALIRAKKPLTQEGHAQGGRIAVGSDPGAVS